MTDAEMSRSLFANAKRMARHPERSKLGPYYAFRAALLYLAKSRA